MHTSMRAHSICFFKQKTAYDIGLGIPAEPLFRSMRRSDSYLNQSLTNVPSILSHFSSRSEERRVGKECRSRWWLDDENKNHAASLRCEVDSLGHDRAQLTVLLF